MARSVDQRKVNGMDKPGIGHIFAMELGKIDPVLSDEQSVAGRLIRDMPVDAPPVDTHADSIP